eukprot:2714892-Rhodomonas_salina.1
MYTRSTHQTIARIVGAPAEGMAAVCCPSRSTCAIIPARGSPLSVPVPILEESVFKSSIWKLPRTATESENIVLGRAAKIRRAKERSAEVFQVTQWLRTRCDNCSDLGHGQADSRIAAAKRFRITPFAGTCAKSRPQLSAAAGGRVQGE